MEAREEKVGTQTECCKQIKWGKDGEIAAGFN